MGKSTLFESARLLVGLNGFEPGQSHALHAHAGMDKRIYVVEGRGVFLLEGRELPIECGRRARRSGQRAARRQEHRQRARLLLLAVLAPAPV